jgi:hypothetical protein
VKNIPFYFLPSTQSVWVVDSRRHLAKITYGIMKEIKSKSVPVKVTTKVDS